MKKLGLVIASLLLCSTALFANGASETTQKQEQKKTTEVNIWTIDRHDATFWNGIFDQYNKTNTDGITANYQVYSDNYISAVDMAFQTGEAPSLMKQDAGFFMKYVKQGKFVDLLPLMDEETKEMVKPVMFEGHNLIDGKLYYIPTGNTCFRLFYNKSLFKKLGLKVPTTLEEMVQCAKTITMQESGNGIYGFACNLKSPTSGLKRSFEPMTELSEGVKLGYDFATGRYDFNKLAPVVEGWKELIKYSFPGCESLDIDPLRTQFAAGKIGMYISYTHAEPGVYANQFPMSEGQEWACAYIPVTEGVYKGKSNFSVTPSYVFNKDSKNIAATWKTYKATLLNKENLIKHYEAGLGISLIPEVIKNAKPGQSYIDNPALLKSDHEFLWPLTPDEAYPQGMIIEGLNYYDTIASILAGQTSVDKGLTALTARYNKALEQGIKDGTVKPIQIPGFSSLQ